MGLKSGVLRLIVAVSIVVMLHVGFFAQTPTALAAAAPPSNQALVLLSPGADLDSAIATIELAGGHVTHLFPQAALIGEVPTEATFPDGAFTVYRQVVDEATLASLADGPRRAAQVWNALLSSESPLDATASLSTLDAELTGDALTPPSFAGTQLLTIASDGDLTPGTTETSEYLIGRVAVGIVLPESDGSVDPSTEDWSADERALVLSEITAALDWWAALEPRRSSHLCLRRRDSRSHHHQLRADQPPL